MGETAQFSIGAEVVCEDGPCGDLRRVVVDPVARAVTHLVVEPKHRRRLGHLVPIHLVDTSGQAIRLRCTKAEFEALENAEETHFLPGAYGEWGYGQDQMFSMPYFGLGMGGMGVGGLGMGGMGMVPVPQAVTYDKVPVGDVEVRRGERVHATDGPIGRVRGLVIDPADHHVTHVLLEEGHLWGKREVAIPISAVTTVAEGVRLKLSKDEVKDLSPVEVDHDT